MLSAIFDKSQTPICLAFFNVVSRYPLNRYRNKRKTKANIMNPEFWQTSLAGET
jgi:hypothetical protein